MTQEMTRYETAPLAPVVTTEQFDLVRRTVAKDATPAELELYMYDCQRHGVHPLDKLLHFTKRQGKYTPITSIDLLRSRAADTGELGGIEDPQYRGEPAGQDFTASVTVYRFVQGTRCPFTATARWTEYKPDAGSSGNGDVMWRKMPYLMLGKCAEALALRKAFPRQLAGLYAKEEMDQAENTGASYAPAPRLPVSDQPPPTPARQIAPASYSTSPLCDVCGAPGKPSKQNQGQFYCANKEAHGGKWYTIPDKKPEPQPIDDDDWDAEFDAIDEASR
jgi:phage recombination protein Bet